MKTYTFRGLEDVVGIPMEVTVEAIDEQHARHLAMVKRWGSRAPNIRPTNVVTGQYAGVGLSLESVV